MSVRAYRVKSIDFVSPSSFNLWHGDKLMEFFGDEHGFYEPLTMNSMGITELPIEALEEAIQKAEELELDEDTIKALKADIEAAKAEDNDWVRYYCF